MAEEKHCFIIMPISTPEVVRDKYRDGAAHFRHVLECLLIPSVEKAHFTPIPPIAEGADLIHAEIVRQLESADLVLCDMSSLNPNVFFEFGIRCALNKPVCVVKDDVTDKVPFDTGILNHGEYKSSLEPWELGNEISKIAKHIETSFARSKGANPLWRYFGAKGEALPTKGEQGTDEKLDLLFMQMDALRQEVASGKRYIPPVSGVDYSAKDFKNLEDDVRRLSQLLVVNGVNPTIDIAPDLLTMHITCDTLPNDPHVEQILKRLESYGTTVIWVTQQRQPAPPNLFLSTKGRSTKGGK